MKKIEKPDFRVTEILTCCYKSVTDEDFKRRLSDSITEIEKYTYEFEEKCAHNQVHELRDEYTSIKLNKDEMIWLYENKLANQKGAGRKYYDSIKLLSSDGRCPFCKIGQVSTVDHFMAKSIFPGLAVSPLNLIPACRDCNTKKKDNRFTTSENTLLHPYYDDISMEIWLKAKIIEEEPISVIFSVIKPDIWSDCLYKRTKVYFESFQLMSLYGFQAVDEIISKNKSFFGRSWCF